jgi:YHS domain-containing protein
MEGLVSFLLFGAFFYFMTRFGCGAHIVHGHGRYGGDERSRETRVADGTDPVCGMALAADQGYAKMYRGQPYRFCSRACLDTFEGNPQQYATPTGGVR